MANLAIKGRQSKGDEVIEILKMLGGKNDSKYNGETEMLCYYIAENGRIECDTDDEIPIPCTIFTIEEFIEKFPYKVGDKVNYVKYNEGNLSVYTIQGMLWNGVAIEYLLDSSVFSALTKDLQPYKEEIVDTGCCSMPNTPPSYKLSVKQLKEMKQTIVFSNDSPDETELVLGDNYEVKVKEGKTYVVKKKPKYPKTFVECAKMLDCFCAAHIDGYYCRLLEDLQALLICRDAYWKIAGKWTPDWLYDDEKYVLMFNSCEICKDEVKHTSYVLAFPTEEMRDAFYENFKELIEECKELL